MVTDIVTADFYTFYKEYFTSEMNYAWPDEDGDMRGLLYNVFIKMWLSGKERRKALPTAREH